jgi:hypothetical protein
MSPKVNERFGAGAFAWKTGIVQSIVAVAISEDHEISLVSMLSIEVHEIVGAICVSHVIKVTIEVHEVSMLSLEVHEVSMLSLEVHEVSLVFILEVIMIVISIEENDDVFINRFDGSTGGFDGTSGVGGTLRHVFERFSRVGSSDGFVTAVGGSDRHVFERFSRVGSTGGFVAAVGGSDRHVFERFSRVGSSDGFVAAVGSADRHVLEGFARYGFDGNGRNGFDGGFLSEKSFPEGKLLEGFLGWRVRSIGESVN